MERLWEEIIFLSTYYKCSFYFFGTLEMRREFLQHLRSIFDMGDEKAREFIAVLRIFKLEDGVPEFDLVGIKFSLK
jgi:hypothetical protein